MKRASTFLLFFALLAASVLAFGCLASDDSGGPGAGVDRDADAAGSDDGFDGSIPTPDANPDEGIEDDTDAVTEEEPDLEPDPEPEVEPDLPEEPDQPSCGALYEPCCAGNSCDGSLTCWEGTCVEPSGCPSDPECIMPPGASCSSLPVTVRTGLPPTLTGGNISQGAFKISAIDFYTDATFSDLVTSATITNNGDTCGTLEFLGPEWGFSATLDLTLNIIALEMEFPQTILQDLYAAGCWTVDGNELVSDITQCSMWVEGADPPESLEFQTGYQSIKFLLILTRETILLSVPEENRELAGWVIESDLPILFTFQAMD